MLYSAVTTIAAGVILYLFVDIEPFMFYVTVAALALSEVAVVAVLYPRYRKAQALAAARATGSTRWTGHADRR